MNRRPHFVLGALRSAWPALAPCLLLAIVVAVMASRSPVMERHAIELLINVVLVVGLYTFAGNSGILSFGHMSFMAVGAYATALLTIPAQQKGVLLPDLPGVLADVHLSSTAALLVVAAFTALVAAVIALPIVRLNGLAASLAMFAVLVIVHEVASNWDAVTRGSSTMIGVPTETTAGSALVIACVVVAISYLYQRSASGLRLRASREDEFAARSTGVNVTRERALAFVLSAAMVAIGGFLYAQFQGAFEPNAFFVRITFLTIAMLVIGGMKSLGGAVVGAAIVSLLSTWFDALEDGFGIGPVEVPGRAGLSATLLAGFFLVALAWRPSGLMQGREFQWPRRIALSRWRRTRPVSMQSSQENQ